MTIEARHAGYINVLLNQIMTDNVYGNVVSFDDPLTVDQVVALAGPFVTSLERWSPLDVLDNALGRKRLCHPQLRPALEYLEAAFYNINVPLFT